MCVLGYVNKQQINKMLWKVETVVDEVLTNL